MCFEDELSFSESPYKILDKHLSMEIDLHPDLHLTKSKVAEKSKTEISDAIISIMYTRDFLMMGGLLFILNSTWRTPRTDY